MGKGKGETAAVELPTEVTKRDLRSVDLLEDDMVHHDKAEWFGLEKIDVSEKTAKDIGTLLVTELPEPGAEAAMTEKEAAYKPGAKRVAKTGKVGNAAYYMPADVKRPKHVDADRVLKYERTFYKLDQNVRGYVRTDEAVAFFTFVRLDLSPKAIDSAMGQLIALSSQEKEDQMVVLSEFLTVASGLLAGVSMDLIDAGIEHFLECRATIQARHNRRWRETAAYIDGKARVWIPTLYFVLLMLIFNLELEDGYTPDENGETVSKKMFYGLPPIIRVEDGMFGYIRILFLPVVFAIFLPLFFVAKQLLLVSLTKLVDDDDEARFALQPDYWWVEKLPCLQWLFSTARHDLGKDGRFQIFGEPCKDSDLDHIISLKINPDKRSKNVTRHVEKTLTKQVQKASKEGGWAHLSGGLGLSGRFVQTKKDKKTTSEAGPSGTTAPPAAVVKDTKPSDDPTAAVASTKDAVQASSFAQGPVAAPEEESQEHQVGVSEL